jgi:hypothetical protein
MWLTDFKVALVQKDIDTLDSLATQLPDFDSVEEMKEAAYLLLEAKKLLESLRGSTQKSLQQLKRNIDFLKSTQPDEASKLNIKL